MAYKLPKQVVLLGKTIPIVREPLNGAYAMFWPGKMSISIGTTCPDHLLEDALLHELVHAVFEISGITNMLELEVEEVICRALENLTNVYKLKGAK